LPLAWSNFFYCYFMPVTPWRGRGECRKQNWEDRRRGSWWCGGWGEVARRFEEPADFLQRRCKPDGAEEKTPLHYPWVEQRGRNREEERRY
jgi:hypothetical protein